MMCIYFAHVIIANRFKRPYFVLHVIVNAINLYICTSGVVEGLMNPQSSVINDVNRGPESQTYIALIFALHFYHPIFFKTGRMDWIHHTPVYILCILMLSVPSGTIFKLQSSILTGLPGGLEYVCLVLEGQKMMTRATVKHYSSMINTWFRLPMGYASGLIAFVGVYHQYTLASTYQCVIFILMGIHAMWNSPFFGKNAIEANVVDIVNRFDLQGSSSKDKKKPLSLTRVQSLSGKLVSKLKPA